jgi:hypothetical protein
MVDLGETLCFCCIIAGLAVSLAEFEMVAVELTNPVLGDISIPALTVSLGVRIADSTLSAVATSQHRRAGSSGARSRDSGVHCSYLVTQGVPKAMFLLFGALPRRY